MMMLLISDRFCMLQQNPVECNAALSVICKRSIIVMILLNNRGKGILRKPLYLLLFQ